MEMRGTSLDRNNNAVRLDRQPQLIHNTSKHLNEGFFGVSSHYDVQICVLYNCCYGLYVE
ncbi:hypothetical protein ANCDUO_19249 [Ancylostoma duodenale]|uniref:Uncharacterized protein n=1 Tax=Ancylostoma duodenale TaxID=51022 RepID=A0A0C2FVG2_9BILA|nr:hypothetical protein ANCDUO_19249 [Ancylostoma duodenale]